VYFNCAWREIFEPFGRFFTSELRESDDIRCRGAIAAFAGVGLVAPAARAVFRKLAFLVILSRKAAR
jgi:hypothetical protein